MPTLNEVYDADHRHLGFSKSRARQYAQRLREEGMFASGAPGKSPDITVDDFLNLLLALAIDATLADTADAVRAYRSLTPGGASLDGEPASLRTAGDFLDIWADWAVHGDADLLRRDKIEVVSSWPEIALHEATGVKRWQPPGSLPNHWQASGHRRSTTINGAALVDALKELFGGRN